jgi:hypothetical protein
MKYFLAFKYMTVFSRELDGTGVNVGDEIVSEIIERASARLIAEDSTQAWKYDWLVSLSNANGRIELQVERALLILLIPIDVLRRTLSNLFDHLGELSSPWPFFYGDNIYLMPPVVAKVEPVSESVIDLQSK